LPLGIEALVFSRKSVVKVSSTLRSTFENFLNTGPNIFSEISAMTKQIWIIYYCLMIPLTLGLLAFAFWTCGFFDAADGQDKADAAPIDYTAPVTCGERLGVWWSSCSLCLKGYAHTPYCFWSCIILLETVIILVYACTVILVVFAYLTRLMQSSCMQIYILGDESICTNNLEKIREFADHFLGDHPLTSTCGDYRLLLCKHIKDSMMASSVLTTIGSIVATILSHQMIIESAILHERSRLKHVMLADAK